MKKVLLSLLCLFMARSAFALPVGNVADPRLYCESFFNDCDYIPDCLCWGDRLNFRVGFYGDYVFNRHLELDAFNNPGISKTEINTNAGLLVLNYCNFIDVFATLGATNLYLHSGIRDFDPTIGSSAPFDIQTETAFSWSIGAKIAFWECNGWILGVEGQYFSTTPDVSDVSVYPIGYAYPNEELEYREWQVGLGLSYYACLGCDWAAVPYVAVKWADAKLTPNHTTFASGAGATTFSDLEPARNWGYALGVTLVGRARFSINGEVRFVDETAASVNVQMNF